MSRDATDHTVADWIVRLDLTDSAIADPPAEDELLLAGTVVESFGSSAPRCLGASVRVQRDIRPLGHHQDRVEVRCTPRDLPSRGNAPPTTSLDHLVHLLCVKILDPDAIERFMEATGHIIRDRIVGRETWLEPIRWAADPPVGDDDEPLFDDVFLARYPDLEAWRGLVSDPVFRRERDLMGQAFSHTVEVVLAPTHNRIASWRSLSM